MLIDSSPIGTASHETSFPILSVWHSACPASICLACMATSLVSCILLPCSKLLKDSRAKVCDSGIDCDSRSRVGFASSMKIMFSERTVRLEVRLARAHMASGEAPDSFVGHNICLDDRSGDVDGTRLLGCVDRFCF